MLGVRKGERVLSKLAEVSREDNTKSDIDNDEQKVSLGRQESSSEKIDYSFEKFDHIAIVGASEVGNSSSYPSEEFHNVIGGSGEKIKTTIFHMFPKHLKRFYLLI